MRIAAALAVALLAIAGCGQSQRDDEAIRAAVKQHLTSLGTLNLQAMDMDFTKITVQNNQANANVSFRPKTGAPAAATMQISYQLEKRDKNWIVIKKSAPEGLIEHPDPNVNPHGQTAPGPVHGKLPNFQEMLGSTNSDATGAGTAAPSGDSNKPQP